eukprot:136064_1
MACSDIMGCCGGKNEETEEINLLDLESGVVDVAKGDGTLDSEILGYDPGAYWKKRVDNTLAKLAVPVSGETKETHDKEMASVIELKEALEYSAQNKSSIFIADWVNDLTNAA